MYNNSVPALMSKNVGNTLANYKTWGGVIYNVVEYGADVTGVKDSTSAIQTAIDAAAIVRGTVFFPPGLFKITSSLYIRGNNVNLQGSASGASSLYTENNIAMVVLDTTNDNMYYKTFSDLSFVANISGTRTSSCGILIQGNSGFRFNYNNFINLLFLGPYYGIRATKLPTAGVENLIDFNLFSGISVSNSGAYLSQYGIKFENGSGTGNIFTSMRIASVQSCIEIGGSTAINVGDIIISCSHFVSAVNAIKLVANPPNYGSNQSVVACQFDAGIQYSLNFTDIDNYTIQGCNWGGGTVTSFTRCRNARVDGQGGLSSIYGTERININAAAVTNVGTIVMQASYDAAIQVEVVSFGIQQGHGAAITTTKYHITTNGADTAIVVQLATNQNGAGLITHSVVVSGLSVAFKATTNGTSTGSNIQSNFTIIGTRYAYSST